MSSTQSLCVSFLKELGTATHDFSVGGDVFKLALYSSSATLNSSTTAYSTTNEVSGAGYSAGGATLTNIAPATSGITAYWQFATPTFTAVTLTARYALIYNSSKANRAVCVLDFGMDKIRTASDLVVTMPTNDANNALIRITEN